MRVCCNSQVCDRQASEKKADAADEDILALLLPQEQRAARAVNPPNAAERTCAVDLSLERSEDMASPVPPSARLPPPETPVARIAGFSAPVPAVHLPGRSSSNLLQRRPQMLQAWAALSMPSGDGTSFNRRATIANGFSGTAQYQEQLAAALSEELHLRRVIISSSSRAFPARLLQPDVGAWHGGELS